MLLVEFFWVVLGIVCVGNVGLVVVVVGSSRWFLVCVVFWLGFVGVVLRVLGIVVVFWSLGVV